MLSETLNIYCRLFHRRHDRKRLDLFLKSSPHYPSLLSVVQALRFSGIDANAGCCESDYLRSLKSPCLLHLRHGRKEILVISRWDPSRQRQMMYDPKSKKWTEMSASIMTKAWDGVVVHSNDVPTGYTWREAIPAFLTPCVSLMTLCAAILANSASGLIVSLPMIFGIFASCHLFFRGDIMHASIVDRLCHISHVADCERVDNSRFSSIYGFKLSCLALSFFISQIVCAVTGHLFGAGNVLGSLYIIPAIIALPATAYSIYGQSRIKTICPLCLVVVSCLIAEAAISISHLSRLINQSLPALFCIIFLVSALMLRYTDCCRQKEAAYRQESIDLLKFKRKKEIILAESIPVECQHSPIWLGEETSPNVVTAVISPGCEHCRQTIAKFLKLLQGGTNFRLDIILGKTAINDHDMIRGWIKCYMTDSRRFIEDMRSWCNKGKPMPGSYPLDGSTDSAVKETENTFRRLIGNLKITGFPRIILNGRLLSPIYSPGDVEFILAD